ncbi:hypothetical protein PBI_INDLOVU_57 [Mycobacterium phage Indlovu]|nr:hypothetical protein PBI_INDLOVU_57 [Mycobacterium phage Indlovu]
MSAPGGMIRDARHLRTLPDGTIISWLRIPGDPTSEAVAFVRREVDPQQGVVVWISPGGWSPHTIEEAGVTFPCEVIRLGDFHPDQYPAAEELPVLTEALAECAHGGTWSREKALECASRVYQGLGVPLGMEAENIVLGVADRFADWLDRELVPEPTMAGRAMEGE